MNVTSRVHPHVTGHESESKQQRRLGKRGLGSYLARQGTVYIFQMRLPKKLGGTANTPPVRLSLGACAYQRARYLADILAAEARLFCEGFRALGKSDETHFPIQPQDLLTEETAEQNLAVLKAYLKMKHHEIRKNFDPSSPSQKEALGALREIIEVRQQLRAKDAGERFHQVVVSDADFLIGNATNNLMASVSQEAIAPASSEQPASDPVQSSPVAATLAPPAPPPKQAALEDVPLAVWVKRGEVKTLSGRVSEVDLDRRFVPRPASSAPLFSEVADLYLSARAGAKASTNKDIETARKRLKLFIEVIGDHPADTYSPADLQAYINAIQYLPANPSDRPSDKTALQLIQANLDRSKKSLALKSIRDGYVTVVKTALRNAAPHYGYRYLLGDMTIHYPEMAARPRPIEPLSFEKISAVMREGVRSGLLEDAMLPLLGLLTGRRLGLLVNLHGSDIVEKYPGVWVVNTTGIRLVVPIIRN